MRRLTQTHDKNCLQTCVAILLDCDPARLPQQAEYVVHDDFVRALRVYLDRHHGLTYVEMPSEQFEQFAEARERSRLPHVLIGPCSRTSPENGEAWHAVIGVGDEMVWDVSPTRAGLTAVEGRGFLIPTPKGWAETWRGESCACAGCRAISRGEAA